MRVENTGEVPLRLVADARLLALEVRAPGAARSVRCVLPDDMRSFDPDDRALFLPAHKSYSQSFDPRLYCFGAREAAALVPDAKVIASLGWHTGNKAFVVEPIGGGSPPAAAAREIVAAEWTIPPAAAPSSTPKPPPPPPDDLNAPKLVVSAPERVDAASGEEIEISVTVRNAGTRRVYFMLHPETLAFDVEGAHAATHCTSGRGLVAIRELFTALGPGEKASLPVLVTTLCPPHTFDEPGLYAVRPSLDTTQASGNSIGLRTFDGRVEAATPLLLRVRHERRSSTPALPNRPSLD
jgi:hypothetical protein